VLNILLAAGRAARADKKAGSLDLRAGLRRPPSWFVGNCDKRFPKPPKLNNPKFLRFPNGLGGSETLELLLALLPKGMPEL